MDSIVKIKILSIDIGIINLGYVFANYKFSIPNINKLKYSIISQNKITPDIEIIDCDRIDITNVKHCKVNYCDCKLYHESCIPDYLDHFIQEYSEMFESSEIIIIERQPPVGITNVQDLLFTKFRHKVILISPVSVHKYFGMSKDYSIRKIESENISEVHLNSFKSFTNNVRKHDISDAMIMLIYFYQLKFNELIKINNIKIVNKIMDFEQFRFC